MLPRLLVSLSLAGVFSPPCGAAAQSYSGNIISEHVRVRVPQDREWLAREAITDLEESWQYMHRVTGDGLPKRVLVEIVWDGGESRFYRQTATVVVGMGSPSARAQPLSYLGHNAAREMALIGLAELSRGATLREENRRLADGMAEILTRGYKREAKGLAGAWVLAHLADRIQPLRLQEITRPRESGAVRDLYGNAPAMTLLLTCQDLYGRERTLKLIEALRKGTLEEAALAALRTRLAALEEAWLGKVRGYLVPETVTVTSEEDMPSLRQTNFAPPVARAGAGFEIRLVLEDGGGNLSARSVFIVDETTGRVFQAQASRSPSTHLVRSEEH